MAADSARFHAHVLASRHCSHHCSTASAWTALDRNNRPLSKFPMQVRTAIPLFYVLSIMIIIHAGELPISPDITLMGKPFFQFCSAFRRPIRQSRPCLRLYA